MPKLVREREAGEKSSIGRTNSFSKKDGWVLGEQIGDKKMCGDVCLYRCRSAFHYDIAPGRGNMVGGLLLVSVLGTNPPPEGTYGN